LDTSRFARTIAQVVQLRATYVTATLDFDRRDQRRIQLERTFHAFTRRDLANDEVRVQTTVTTRDHDAFVCLCTLAGAFDHVDADGDRIARCKVGDVLAETGDFFLLELLDQIHFPLL